MIADQQRQSIVELINQACAAGARKHRACAVVGLSVRTLQRWCDSAGCLRTDRRAKGQQRRASPAHRLSAAEREAALAVVNSCEFKDLPPSQIVPRLADQGRYVASESTLYRLLRAAGQMGHRRSERAPQKRHKPRSLTARKPNEVYCWDITYLPSRVRGVYFYLYLFTDLFSRKIVGWQVFEAESAEHASALMQDICSRHGIAPGELTLHSDNGAPMKGETMLATLERLGVARSFSRPAVSNDNPYAESIFKTLKYRPQWPVKPFEDVVQARRWAQNLQDWYNDEHRHSAIGFVTPSQRYAGHDMDLLKARTAVYAAARQANPRRWTTSIRSWHYIAAVNLNPDSNPQQEAPNTPED